VIQKTARKGEDGNPDGSQMDLNDVIIVWEPLVKRGDSREEGGPLSSLGLPVVLPAHVGRVTNFRK
jgi:hypothetical protein